MPSTQGSDGLGDDIVAQINITPLTDIFLVLLIIFMVTSTAMIQQGAPVDVPRAPGGVATGAGVIVTVTADHQLSVNDKIVSLDQLKEALASALQGSAERTVILRGDRHVMLEDAVQIMTVAKEAGAAKIAIATEPQGSAPAPPRARAGSTTRDRAE